MMMMKEIGLYRRKGVGKGVVRTKNVKKMRVCVCVCKQLKKKLMT